MQLLLGVIIDMEATEQAAREILVREPTNWAARSTIALARLKTGRAAAALETYSDIKITGLLPSNALAIRAAVLAANGWKDDAKQLAQKLAAARLLPEERQLIAPLLDDAPTLP